MINLRSDFQTPSSKGNTTKSKNLQYHPFSSLTEMVYNISIRHRLRLLSFVLICLVSLVNIYISQAQTTKTKATPNLHKTSDLLIHITKLSPSNLFLKGHKPVNGLSYHYSNWNGKGGIQVFSGGENVKMLSIVAITNTQSLPHLKTPVPIDKLITDLLGKPDGKWFIESLSKLTKSKTELISKDRQVAMAYNEQVQKLTVTIRLL